MGLKPCPFCASTDVVGKYAMDEFNQLGTAYIVCMGCRARGSYEYGEQQARDAWNLRGLIELDADNSRGEE